MILVWRSLGVVTANLNKFFKQKNFFLNFKK